MLLQELKRTIADGDAVLVLGTGVTMATTGNAPGTSWPGLIEGGPRPPCRSGLAGRGLARTGPRDPPTRRPRGPHRRRPAGRKPAEACERVRRVARSGDRRPRGRRRPALPRHREHPRAESRRANYDLLGEAVLSRGSTSWNNHLDVAAWLRMEAARRPLFHLHGIRGPTSSRSFSDSPPTRRSAPTLHAQFVQKVLAATRSFVFIGCGAGLEGPERRRPDRVA